jgi:hypothetical protein
MACDIAAMADNVYLERVYERSYELALKHTNIELPS